MKYKRTIFILFFLVTPLYSQNPFFSQKKQKEVRAERTVHLSIPGAHYILKLNTIQKKLNARLSSALRAVKSGSVGAFFTMMFISFLYGIIHALGPGHGKSIISAYFLGQEAHPAKGVAAGFLTALIHAFSALAIISGIYFIIKASFLSTFEHISWWTRVVSFSAIILIGLYLAVHAIGGILHPKKKEESTNRSPSFYGVVFSSGVVPCPGAAMIILFSLNMDILPAGVAAVFFMSLGMGVTISAAGVGAILIQKGGLRLGGEKWIDLFPSFVEILSSLFIIALGTFLLAGVFL